MPGFALIAAIGARRMLLGGLVCQREPRPSVAVKGRFGRGFGNPHRYSSASLNEGSTLGQLKGALEVPHGCACNFTRQTPAFLLGSFRHDRPPSGKSRPVAGNGGSGRLRDLRLA